MDIQAVFAECNSADRLTPSTPLVVSLFGYLAVESSPSYSIGDLLAFVSSRDEATIEGSATPGLPTGMIS